MESWSKDFSSNTELGIMEQAFMRLKAQSELDAQEQACPQITDESRSQFTTPTSPR